MAVASALRDHGHGRVVSYSRKVFIPLTNICRDRCAYCTFVKYPGDPAARIMEPEEVLAVARAGRAAGCKEALFSLGERPETVFPEVREWLRQRGYDSMLAYLRDCCELVFRETGLLPHPNPGTLTEDEVRLLKPVSASMGMMLESTSQRLLRPGGAHHGCPDKAPQRRLATLEAAGRQRVPFTTGILIGIGETPEERVDALFAIKAVHERFGHIQEVIVQNFRAKPGTAMADAPEPSPLEMLKTLAVARIVLGPHWNLQAPPNLAADAYQLYLLAGINDWGGISPVTVDHINPEASWPHLREVERLCAEAGFRLVERLTVYPRFAGDGWLAPELWRAVAAWIDETGFVRREACVW
ncbi:MAG: 7,8-didemethyl-8-hydroxy-5-deazariboflavin synthase CofG [Clostridia bacterium]|nr:7,8-didemethyl-8-hydroxy-5-deazariboflavin synthase CofG [Clostridia bacterium]